jgi:hypothetical protein
MENSVVSNTKIKEWTNPKGEKVPIYKVEFADFTFAESFGKEIPVGTLLTDLIIEDGQYGRKVKMKPTGSAGGGFKKQTPNNAAFCMAYSKDLVVAGKIPIDQMSKYAELMYSWIESKTK